MFSYSLILTATILS